MSLKIQENVPLGRLTSLHIGGPARYVISITSVDEALEAIKFAHEKKLPFFVLGKGSNTLFPDSGYEGVILLMSNRSISIDGTRLTAGAGTFMRMLVNKALENNLRGLEELAGIPGTVGGAVRGNAGTWDTDVKKVLVEAHVLKPEASGEYQLVTMPAIECEFTYRHSIFKSHPDWIIMEAVFELKPGNGSDGQTLVAKDLEQRHTRQPYDAPSAGSVFKNPDKANGIFSGKLVEAAGLKGKRVGGAEISPKHGNFIVNRGGATAADVLALIALVQAEVKQKFNVTLEPEIEIVGGLDKK
ncbi:MAG: UDP-N-acetylmuramate dehydrogenase [Candidatus Andersenbacteria bacterium]|nr:UDP-N-acetylmuramate dehydrogenase [Candidatus Andersenbacteria bacterium]